MYEAPSLEGWKEVRLGGCLMKIVERRMKSSAV